MATIVTKTNDLEALRKAVSGLGLTVEGVEIEFTVRISVPTELLDKQFPPDLLWKIQQVSGVSFTCFELPRRAEETKEVVMPVSPTPVEAEQCWIGDIL